MQIEDPGRVDHNLDAALGALVFTLENNNPVARIDELLWFDPVLIPHFVIFGLEGLTDLAEATQDLAFLQAPDRPMHFNVRIEQVRHAAPIPPLQELRQSPHDLHVPCDIAYS